MNTIAHQPESFLKMTNYLAFRLDSVNTGILSR